MKVFYHSADLDGRCSAAIVRRAHPEAELIGIDYGQDFPCGDIRLDERVWMVDFSLQPWAEMKRLFDIACVTWIDHHKSAIEDYRADVPAMHHMVVLDTNKAACELAWAHCFPAEPVPEAVTLLGRYDVWDWQNHEGALEFQYGMRGRDSSPTNDTLWRALFKGKTMDMDVIKLRGRVILDYEASQNREFIRAYGFETELDGFPCIACNRGMTNSKVFDGAYDPARHDMMMTFAWKDGRWTVSLYADKKGVDVGAICKARGGGGHAGAAGFQCDTLPFLFPPAGVQ